MHNRKNRHNPGSKRIYKLRNQWGGSSKNCKLVIQSLTLKRFYHPFLIVLAVLAVLNSISRVLRILHNNLSLSLLFYYYYYYYYYSVHCHCYYNCDKIISLNDWVGWKYWRLQLLLLLLLFIIVIIVHFIIVVNTMLVFSQSLWYCNINYKIIELQLICRPQLRI